LTSVLCCPPSGDGGYEDSGRCLRMTSVLDCPPSGDGGYEESVDRLLADTEAREEGIEDVIGTDFPGDLA
jgi:hypothetical protein